MFLRTIKVVVTHILSCCAGLCTAADINESKIKLIAVNMALIGLGLLYLRPAFLNNNISL